MVNVLYVIRDVYYGMVSQPEFLIDVHVCDYYVLVADRFCFFVFFAFSVFIVSHQCCYSNFSFSIHLLTFVPYTWNDLSHRQPALMVLTFPAAYHNRNVTFFSLASLWLINFFLFLLLRHEVTGEICAA